MKNINKYIIHIMLVLILLLVSSCGKSDNIDVISCLLKYEDGMELKQEFSFVEDDLKEVYVSIKSDLSSVEDKKYKTVIRAMEAIIDTQNEMSGVRAKLNENINKKTIEETIKVNIDKYNVDKDYLELFANKKISDINQKFVTDKYIKDNFEVYKNGELIK